MRILLTFIFQMVRFLLHNVFLFLKSVIYPPLLTQIKSAAGPRICDLCLKSIKYQPHTKSLSQNFVLLLPISQLSEKIFSY